MVPERIVEASPPVLRRGLRFLARRFRSRWSQDDPAEPSSLDQSPEVPAQAATVLFIEQAVAFGGAFVVMADLIRRLRLESVRPIVVTAMDPRFVKERIEPGVALVRARHVLDYARVASWVERLSNLGVPRTLAAYSVSLVGAVVNLGYSLRMARLIARHRVDLIHVNNGTGHMEFNLVLFPYARRCVVHVHGLSPLASLERIFLRRVGAIVAISEAVRQNLVSQGVDEDLIAVIPNPVGIDARADPAQTALVRQRLGVPADAHLVGIFGRLMRWKGQLEFLRAMEHVMAGRDDVYAVIVGDVSDGGDHYANSLRQWVTARGLQARVLFLGYVSDVASYYHAMDVVVHSSIDPEPFGLVITEAMACGKPVVASDRGAPAEIITHGEDGYLADPDDPVFVAQCIRELLDDESLRRAMGARGKEAVHRKYDPIRYARRIECLYQKVMSESASARGGHSGSR